MLATLPRHVLACVFAILINAACLCAAFAIAALYDVRPSVLYRDPSAVTGSKFIIGWFSNLGAVGWFSAATACLFAASFVHNGSRPSLLLLGVLTLALGIDDLFMIHDGL